MIAIEEEVTTHTSSALTPVDSILLKRSRGRADIVLNLFNIRGLLL